MKGGVYLDAEAPNLVRHCYALVCAQRGKRERFPESVVEVVPSPEDALARQDPAQGVHAAELVGPSRSSEGFRLYYLVRWLS
ncbi:MAG: hypothetical protein N2441_07305 [Rhodocyclaceae bacterium]|nr:hypothetical protein [Rhodocyclaceae bacterium]